MTRPRIDVLVPEGWVRLTIDATIDEQVKRLTAELVREIEQSRRDIARVQLRRMFTQLTEAASGGRAYEVWLPVAPTGGVTIPATVTVGPLPRVPDPELPAAEALLGLSAASPGASAGEVDGRLAVRIVRDSPAVKDDEGQYTSLPRRGVTTIVSPASSNEEWLAFHTDVIVPDTDDAADIVAATEFFSDALLATIRIRYEESAR